MPELPEVETVVRALRPYVVGEELLRAEVFDPRLGLNPAALGLPAPVRGLRRRGKYILLELPENLVVIHLRMSGRLVWGETPPQGRVRLALHFPEGAVYLVDRRRLATAEVVPQFDQELGPEPFGDLSWLPGALRRSRMPIKGWLLDQGKIAGIGNIYAAEILYRAGIDPRRPAASLNKGEARRLARAIPQVLQEAIKGKGTTLPDAEYRQPSGELGAFQFRLFVYGRAGEACPACGTPIARVKIAGRSTYFCPKCQK